MRNQLNSAKAKPIVFNERLTKRDANLTDYLKRLGLRTATCNYSILLKEDKSKQVLSSPCHGKIEGNLKKLNNRDLLDLYIESIAINATTDQINDTDSKNDFVAEESVDS